MRRRSFLLLVTWLCLSLGAYAQTTYYVGPEGSDDENDGLAEETAFETIGYAISQVTTNDVTIQVLTGTYGVETIEIDRPVIISGLGQNPIINPAAENSNPLFSIASTGVIIEGLTLSTTSENGTGILFESVSGESIDNPQIRQNTISGFATGIAFQNSAIINNLSITNNFITNNTNGIVSNIGVALAGNDVSANSFAGNGTAIANYSEQTNNLINAQANWWGTSTSNGVTGKLVNVNRTDHSPWLFTGDDNPNIEGFQPSYEKLGVHKTTNNTNALTDALALVNTDGEISVYQSIIAGNTTYEDITIEKSITLNNVIANDIIPIDSITTNGGNLIITGNFQVNNIYLLSGNIETKNNILLLSAEGTIIEAEGSQFIGEIQTSSFNIPADEEFSLLGLTFSQAAGDVGLEGVTISRFTGENAEEVIDNIYRSIQVRWDIDVPNQNNISPRDITFSWKSVFDGNMEFDGLDALIWKRENASSPWEEVSRGQISTESNTREFTVSNVTGFSQWTLSDEENPLPVELTQFTASLLESHVELNWETASEINSDFFAVERSENGQDFKEVGQLKAAGDSDTPLQYRYIDEQVANRFSGSLFYRLRTVDFDGSFEYSDITIVTLSDDDIPMIAAFAREGQQSLKLFTRAIEAGDYRVWITDLSGRKVFEQDLQLAPKEAYELGVGHLSQSVYLIRCEGRDMALSSKFRVEVLD